MNRFCIKYWCPTNSNNHYLVVGKNTKLYREAMAKIICRKLMEKEKKINIFSIGTFIQNDHLSFVTQHFSSCNEMWNNYQTKNFSNFKSIILLGENVILDQNSESNLLRNGRHYQIRIITTCETPHCLSPSLRFTFGYIFILFHTNPTVRNSIYKTWFKSIENFSFQDFEKIFQAINQENKCFILKSKEKEMFHFDTPVNLPIAMNCLTTIIGPRYSGKTTLAIHHASKMNYTKKRNTIIVLNGFKDEWEKISEKYGIPIEIPYELTDDLRKKCGCLVIEQFRYLKDNTNNIIQYLTQKKKVPCILTTQYVHDLGIDICKLTSQVHILKIGNPNVINKIQEIWKMSDDFKEKMESLPSYGKMLQWNVADQKLDCFSFDI